MAFKPTGEKETSPSSFIDGLQNQLRHALNFHGRDDAEWVAKVNALLKTLSKKLAEPIISRAEQESLKQQVLSLTLLSNKNKHNNI